VGVVVPYQYHNNERQLVGLDIESFKAIMTEAQLTLHHCRDPMENPSTLLKNRQDGYGDGCILV